MRDKKPSSNMPWMTADGELDMSKFPIDGILQQAMSAEDRDFHSGLGMLGSMYSHGRKEAGIFLLGLLLSAEDNWDRRIAIVQALQGVATRECANLLFSELKRVKSSNTTRRYLTAIIRVLSGMPSELTTGGFTALANDKSFSPKMQAKFKEVLEQEEFDAYYF